MHSARLSTVAFILASSVLALPALAVSCGTDQPDQKFWAVCGLAPRDRDYDQDWAPEGSGTLVRWT
ncbi:MAG: hypothetical protein JNK58_04140, partial [Phycisphaerae bacterium]|nr:hypothetical protein [Phycisphaerae bacterium]